MIGRRIPARIAARERGVATVEMAIMLPLLLLMVVAVAEVGRAFVQYTALSNAVRNGARYAAGKALAGTTGVISLPATLITETRNVVLYGGTSTGTTPALPGLQANQITVARAGSDITVTAVYPYESMFGGSLPTFGSGDAIDTGFNMRVIVRMRPL